MLSNVKLRIYLSTYVFSNLLKLNHFIYIQEEIYEIMGEEVNLYLAGVNRLKEDKLFTICTFSS